MKISKKEYNRLKEAERERDALKAERIAENKAEIARLKAELKARKWEPIFPPPTILWPSPWRPIT